MNDEHILRHAYLHFVWATKQRLPLVTEAVEANAYRYISAVCKQDKCELLAIGGMPDHLHLFVRFSNTLRMSDFMRHVKGGSSRLISKALNLDARFVWQRGYAVFSVELAHLDTVIDYIRNQKQRHATGKLWLRLHYPTLFCRR